MEEYLLHLENKIESEFQVRVDNNKLLTSLLSSAKISSIDEITEMSTTIPSIKQYNTNHAKNILPFVEINTTSPTDIDIITLATVIASAVATEDPTKTLRLPPFTPSDIKFWLHSIITQLSYIIYFTPLLNSTQSFVSIKNASENDTVDAVQLSKTISNLTMKRLNHDSISKSWLAILALLQTKIYMSKSPNDIDILYKNW